ncbi:hypothetical protein [Acinetobacter baumannii]
MTHENESKKAALNAPACFGAVSCFSSDSAVCKECPAFEQCIPAVSETLNRIKGVINVEDYLKKHEKAKREVKERIEARMKQEKIEQAAERREMPMPKMKVARKTKVEKVEFKLSDDQNALIAELPVKAQSFAVQLCKTGLVDRIKKDLTAGVNPLEKTGPKWLAILVELLIKGGVTRAELKSEYMKRLEWSDGTAGSHTSLAFKIFPAFKIAIESESKLVANPQLFESN